VQCVVKLQTPSAKERVVIRTRISISYTLRCSCYLERRAVPLGLAETSGGHSVRTSSRPSAAITSDFSLVALFVLSGVGTRNARVGSRERAVWNQPVRHE
jgi:hypothetical protein